MPEIFINKLLKSVEKRNSLLCVGLDPQMDIAFEDDVITIICNFTQNIIKLTYEYAACYKPNIAFYEQFGPEGLMALKRTLDMIPDEIPVIIDAKRSDIGNTARAYAKSIFGNYNADAVTLNPYLGKESVLPFLEYGGRGLFILCRTSNPGSAAFQTLRTIKPFPGNREFYLNVAEEVSGWSPEIGLVVAANDPAALQAVRSLLPGIWILAPGIGPQGGSIEEAISAGLGKNGHNILLNVSRGIANAPLPGKKAREIRDRINRARQKVKLVVEKQPDNSKNILIRDIVKEGCFQLGNFKVKSGDISPFYIDLRKLISNPGLLGRVAAAYSSLIKDLEYDRLAGIPLAGVPIATAVALQLQQPMVLPRIQKKEHGTGNKIEGNFTAGEKVILIDDLITSGKSKLEACDILKEGGIIVEDLVVLIERGSQGRQDLENAGIRLHAFLNIEDILKVCLELGMIDDDKLAEIREFVNR